MSRYERPPNHRDHAMWWEDARLRTDILDVRGTGAVSRNITAELVALEQAGLPATIESFDTIRLADGRRARIADAISPRPYAAGGPDDPPELLFVPMSPFHMTLAPMMQVARTAPNLLLVRAPHVWVDGRRLTRRDPLEKEHVDRFGVYAVARTLPVASGRIDQLADRTGLSVGRVGDALAVLGDNVRHVDVGWEAVDMFDLADWAMTYDGAGGIATQWTHPGSFEEQARLLIGAGLLVSGAWAAMTPFPGLPDLGRHGDIERGMTRLAYARTMPDLTELGFTLSPPPRDGPTPKKFSIVVPEDTTIFATANHSAGGTTDDTITAASVLHGYGEVALGNQVRGRIHFRADMHYDLIHNLPD
jgi:hypothetical protein